MDAPWLVPCFVSLWLLPFALMASAPASLLLRVPVFLVPAGAWLAARYFPLRRRVAERLLSLGRRNTEVVVLGEIGDPAPCELQIPHFMFTDPYISHDVYQRTGAGGTLLIDRLLHRISPCNWLCESLSHGRVAAGELTGRGIRKFLAQGKPYRLFPGGFMETVGITATREVLYLGSLGYHLKQVRRAGSRMSLLLVYDANPLFVNIEWFAPVRAFFARRGVPVAMPDPVHFMRSLVRGKGAVFVRRVSVDGGMGEEALAALVLRTYRADADALLRDHGVRMRSPEVHFRDARAPMR